MSDTAIIDTLITEFRLLDKSDTTHARIDHHNTIETSKCNPGNRASYIETPIDEQYRLAGCEPEWRARFKALAEQAIELLPDLANARVRWICFVYNLMADEMLDRQPGTWTSTAAVVQDEGGAPRKAMLIQGTIYRPAEASARALLKMKMRLLADAAMPEQKPAGEAALNEKLSEQTKKGDGERIQIPPLSKAIRKTLLVLAEMNAANPATIEAIHEAMELGDEVAERLIGPAINHLQNLGFADRPLGPRGGAIATPKGRRAAHQIKS